MSDPAADRSDDVGADYERVWRAVRDIEGWMTHGQGLELFAAARCCPPGGRIVEIGSFRGRSTVVLALGAPLDADVIAIDPHAGNDRGPQEISGFDAEAAADHEQFWDNLRTAGVQDRVRHLRCWSDAALDQVDGQVDVLYVDGAHRYGPARADLRDWGARVRDGGTLLVHDSFSSVGVTLAIVRELLGSTRFRYVGRSRSLAVYRADPAVSRSTSVRRQVAQLPWFAKNLAVKVLVVLGLLSSDDWPY